MLSVVELLAMDRLEFIFLEGDEEDRGMDMERLFALWVSPSVSVDEMDSKSVWSLLRTDPGVDSVDIDSDNCIDAPDTVEENESDAGRVVGGDELNSDDVNISMPLAFGDRG